MNNSFSRGFPFDPSDIWHLSAQQSEHNAESLFQPSVSELDFEEVNKLDGSDLWLPELDGPNGIGNYSLDDVDSRVESSLSASIVSGGTTLEASADVWTLDFDLGEQHRPPVLHSWETFERKHGSTSIRTTYLSEAGPRVFDSALTHLEDRVAAGSGVLPQDVMLRALCNLAVGRSSLFFQWDEAQRLFVQTLPEVSISGHSSMSSNSLTKSMIQIGTTYHALSEFTSMATLSNHACPAINALRKCVESILECLEMRITSHSSEVCSILQLQRLVERPRQLLEMLQQVTRSLEDCLTDEDVISILSEHVHQLTDVDTSFSNTLRLVLARVSGPWLERLRSDLGLCAKGFHTDIGRIQDEREDDLDIVDSSFASQTRKIESLPNFISNDDRTLIEDTKANIKLLRRYLPNIDVFLPDYTRLKRGMLNHGDLDLVSDLFTANTSLQDIQSAKLAIGKIDGFENNFNSVAGSAEDLVWADPNTQQAHLSSIDALMSQSFALQTQLRDRLHGVVTEALGNNNPFDSSNALLGSQDLNPLERLRPSIILQAGLTNRALLRHLFWSCRLRHHLDLQRQYHLFGNGDFVSRLATALFSSETQSAERKRGTTPTGKTIGLRLGTRDSQRWPPASSELRLTLMGVLTETYHSEAPAGTTAADAKSLPGGLSFSIRELPDRDIARVMDSGSLYALDFLRLQYAAPPCVDAILTPASMQAYDSIFRFLLRMLRVLDITTQLQSTTKNERQNRSSGRPSAERCFAIAAHHFVLTLMSHFIYIGIETAWRQFTVGVDRIEQSLSEDDQNGTLTGKTPPGFGGLCELHKVCLDSIRSRLFLRRKQEKLRGAIESVCAAILETSSATAKEDSSLFQTRLATFERSLSNLLALLRATIEKPSKTTMNADMAEGEVEAVTLLLTRLNWNDFYEQDTPSLA